MVNILHGAVVDGGAPPYTSPSHVLYPHAESKSDPPNH